MDIIFNAIAESKKTDWKKAPIYLREVLRQGSLDFLITAPNNCAKQTRLPAISPLRDVTGVHVPILSAWSTFTTNS